MARKFSKRLVIDASIAQAAGGTDAIYPTSKYCRDFLDATLHICHQVVMTPAILAEWNQHQSNHAQLWRARMVRKKTVWLDATANETLRQHLTQLGIHTKQLATMQKDVHLVEAALATDQSIISLDETVRKLFATAAQHIRALKNIVWVNPTRETEQPIRWLQHGAKPEPARRLGFTQKLLKD